MGKVLRWFQVVWSVSKGQWGELLRSMSGMGFECCSQCIGKGLKRPRDTQDSSDVHPKKFLHKQVGGAGSGRVLTQTSLHLATK